MAEVSESEEDHRASVRFSTHGTSGGTVNNINGHYIYGHLNHFDIHLPPIPASEWGPVLEEIRKTCSMPLFNAEQPSIHSPSGSNISQDVLAQSTSGICHSSDEGSIIRIRVMIEMVRTMMLNPMLCSSANLLETLTALERVLLLTELAVEAYRHTPLAKSLSHAIAKRVDYCRKLLQELVVYLSDYRRMLSEAFLYFIRRYVCRRLGQGGMGPVMDSRLRECHKSFAACLFALGRAAWPELERGSGQETLASLAEFYRLLQLESTSLMHITVDSFLAGKITLVLSESHEIDIPLQDFHTVISGFCKDTAGYYFIQRGNYRILNSENDSVISRMDISTSLVLGMKVEMSIMLHTQAEGKQGSQAHTCPRCKHVNRKIVTSSGWLSCQKCQLRFHNSTDDGSINSPEVRPVETEKAPQDIQYFCRISVLQDTVHEMEIIKKADAEEISPRDPESSSASDETRTLAEAAAPLPGASTGAAAATGSETFTSPNQTPTAQQVVHQPADTLINSIYKDDLAKVNALKDKSAALLDLGQRQDALAAITEATDLIRALASKHPALNAELALSLRVLSSRLGDAGRREEALSAIAEAVKLQRALANERPTEFKVELASSLNHQSNRLSRLDRHEEALMAIQESVDQYRAAVEDQPETSQPGLAASLYNLSARLSKYDLQEEALAAIHEASGIYQQLAVEDSATYERKHKLSLARLSDCLKSFGQKEDTIAASFPGESAARHRDRAASDRPGEATVYPGPIFNTIGTFGGTVNNVVGDYVTVDEDLEGASWNPQLTCLPGTRLAMLADIDTWAHQAGSEKICLLEGPAECGKSALLHTIAEKFQCHGHLASAFFFSRDAASRNTTTTLFTTLARDLASLHPRAAADICAALEAEPALASASLSRQFDALILGPSRHLPTDRAAVFAIDALDESINHDLDTELLAILRDKATQLPPQVRILVASRPTSIIEEYLSGRSHIKMHSIDIFSSENKHDIDMYVDAQLRDEAILLKMGLTSPDEIVIRDLKRLAEGLFVWIVTVCNFLRTAYRPKDKLQALLSKSYRQGSPPEKKMDLLYAAILAECGDWEDSDFVRDYDLVMGTIMALKRPLSLAALRALHGGGLNLDAEQLLQRFGSVLTGFRDAHQPIRMLHSSFHEFVTDRAANEESTKQFYLSERRHSGRLAELCVKTLNRELAEPIAGTGYLARDDDDAPGIPEIYGVSEQLVYSCAHWLSHLQDVETPQTIQAHIITLFSRNLVTWIEVLAATDVFRGSLQIRQWVQRRAPELEYHFQYDSQANAMSALGNRLSHAFRMEESLLATEEGVILFRILARGRPAMYNGALASSLANFSSRLSALGRSEEAMPTINEAVNLYRALAAERPAEYNAGLASSLIILSNRLSDLGRVQEALSAVEEAVNLYRALAAERPAAYNGDLAMGLGNLSANFGALGRTQEALSAAEEMVILFRSLATERPEAYNAHLAKSLQHLCRRLTDLGRQEEALIVIPEVVDLYRALAAERPAQFNRPLLLSLQVLNNAMLGLGIGVSTEIREEIRYLNVQGGSVQNSFVYSSRIAHESSGGFPSIVPPRVQLPAGLGSRARCLSPWCRHPDKEHIDSGNDDDANGRHHQARRYNNAEIRQAASPDPSLLPSPQLAGAKIDAWAVPSGEFKELHGNMRG
ncbi:hypothetical protein HWV62_39938 [Athelia sp. TMB]|nr:hypothetical protein HWV62_39938 [Athelia sp. TMB]